MTRSRCWIVALVVALGTAPGCITLDDRAGVDVRPDDLARCVPGQTTRQEVLQLLGPPTGYFDTDLLAVLTRFTSPLGEARGATRLDDDVFTYQGIDVRGRAAFFPILFFWVRADFHSRTAIVLFDDAGVVRQVAYREDRS